MTNIWSKKNEALKELVYSKLEQEQEEYRKWLCSMPKEEMLTYAYEYSMREAVISAFDICDLDDAELEKLLTSKNVLERIAKLHEKNESENPKSYIDVLENEIRYFVIHEPAC